MLKPNSILIIGEQLIRFLFKWNHSNFTDALVIGSDKSARWEREYFAVVV